MATAANIDAARIDAEVRAKMPTTPFASEDEWCEYEMSRGDLAGVPEFMHCTTCGEGHAVVREGGVVAERFDATQTYILSCGHTVI